MAFVPAAAHPLIQKLLDAGVLPHNCTDATLRMPAAGVISLELEVLIEEESFSKIVDALISDQQGDAERLVQRVLMLKTPFSGNTRVRVELTKAE